MATCALVLLSLVVPGCAGEAATDVEVTTVEWFIGLGTGSAPNQLEVERKVVADFNAAHSDIELKLTVVDAGFGADVLADRLENGDPPDIIGPVGIGQSERLGERFATIDESIVDLSSFPRSQLGSFLDAEGNVLGVPIGVAPAVVFYNKTLFDRANLPYPPSSFGEPYRGKVWDFENLAETARLLTLDKSGRNSTETGFLPDGVVQWGFHDLYLSEPRALGSEFGAGSLTADGRTAQVPDAWRAQWSWYHKLIWTDFAAPNATQANSSTLSNGNVFASGNVAMAVSHSWYAPGLVALPITERLDWDMAVMPSYQGNTTSRTHIDSFRILQTANVGAAQRALAYLIGTPLASLMRVYGMVPVRQDLRGDYLSEREREAPDQHWQVVLDSLAYVDVPSHETALPNHDESQRILEGFFQQVMTDPEMDVDRQADDLISALNDSFSKALVEPSDLEATASGSDGTEDAAQAAGVGNG